MFSGMIDNFITSVSEALAGFGSKMVDQAMEFWAKACEIVILLCSQNPQTSGGWSYIQSAYDYFHPLAAIIIVCWFYIGWMRETTDLRKMGKLESWLPLFIRFALAAVFCSNALDWSARFMGAAAQTVAELGVQTLAPSYTSVNDLFMDAVQSQSGSDALATGFVLAILGLLGWAAIIVCSFMIIMTGVKRIFNVLIGIPFAGIALATFAGGERLNQTAISWVKTYLGYVLEVIVIVFALNLSFHLFGSGSSLLDIELSGASLALGTVATVVLPLVATTACVSGAEMVTRKWLGL